jgi:hypothetical protein
MAVSPRSFFSASLDAGGALGLPLIISDQAIPSPRGRTGRARCFEHRAVLDAIAAPDAEGAREATTALPNHAARDLVKIRGRDFVVRATPAGASASAGAGRRSGLQARCPDMASIHRPACCGAHVALRLNIGIIA